MAIASGISVAPAVGNEAMRRRPPRRPAIAASAVVGGLQAGDDRLRVADEGLARGGEADAAGVALEQRHAGFGLQRGDLLGDRRLGVGRAPRAAAESEPR